MIICCWFFLCRRGCVKDGGWGIKFQLRIGTVNLVQCWCCYWSRVFPNSNSCNLLNINKIKKKQQIHQSLIVKCLLSISVMPTTRRTPLSLQWHHWMASPSEENFEALCLILWNQIPELKLHDQLMYCSNFNLESTIIFWIFFLGILQTFFQ